MIEVNSKRLLIGIILVALITTGAILVFSKRDIKEPDSEDPSISSYEDCIAAGYKAIGSNQCKTPSGKRFIQASSEEDPANDSVEVEVTGELVCLPYWDSTSPHIPGCKVGLLDDYNNYFVLTISDSSNSTLDQTTPQTRVEISGKFLPGSDEKYRSVGQIEIEKLTPWKNISSEDGSITIQYPEQLDSNYVKTVDWPPEIQITEGLFSCTRTGKESNSTGEVDKRAIGERVYCITTQTEGAAGSLYRQYKYVFSKGDNELVSLTFSLQYPHCENYDNPEKASCKAEQQKFNVDELVKGMVGHP